MLTHISVRGAREHNLRSVDIDLPRDRLIVITGLSGSGKSSLAFDTIYAEGQRRYVESLSAYARQFLELMQKPDVDHIEGLSPAISIEQKTTSRNPRSTVGTVTEIYDYMRLLWARVGVPHSPATGLPIEAQTVSQMVDRVLALPEGTRILLLAPVVRGRKGEYRREIADWKKAGFQRLRIDGELHDIEDAPALDKKHRHSIDIVVDRLVVRPDQASRLAESFETALRLADGLATVERVDGGEPLTFSEKFACPVSGFTLPEIEPRLFSFNAPQGACPACNGLGERLFFAPDLIVPNDAVSLGDGAIVPWAKSSPPSPYYMQVLASVVRACGGTLDQPWSKLPEATRHAILHGTGGKPIPLRFEDGRKAYEVVKPFEGVIANLDRRFRETESAWMKEELGRYQASAPCEACGGARLRPEALSVRIAGESISDSTRRSVAEAARWFAALPDRLTPKQNEIAQRILKEINERLGFLVNVGLGYLGLDRTSGTLSGGESQRIRLASQIGSGLSGVLYVLDEPSIGLHQRDNDRLLQTLKRLRDLGNTVLVVEHDEDAIRAADHVVDMGPGAGRHGGQVVAAGTLDDILASPGSLTGDYLAGRRKVAVPARRRQSNGRQLTLGGARANNLKGVTASIPLGTFTCVTGVSGSGKSSLVIDTLWPAAARALNGARIHAGPHDSLEGLEHLDKVIDIDQSPIGRTPRSNPATYTQAFTHIRDWFAELPEARARGYRPGRFSFNVKGGRCEACQGDGMLRIEMHFLPDVYVQCDVCHGKRYNRETLEVTFKGHSIADVLDMTVADAVRLFEAVPPIRDRLRMLEEVGLGYIHVGQQATTLSGGEAQRVKLARELSRRATGRTLYILDEPTTGLHFEDVRRLLDVLHALVDQGNTVVVIEHNLEVIKTADWVIDLGPEGGAGGGEIVAAGTPEDVVKAGKGFTAGYLKPLLA